MILVDTSVWIDHLRSADQQLQAALDEGEVLVHPLILGELACGNLRNRVELFELLQALPGAREATHAEALALIDRRSLMGRGIGYVDVSLLAAAALTPETRLWTRDRRLARIAAELGLAETE